MNRGTNYATLVEMVAHAEKKGSDFDAFLAEIPALQALATTPQDPTYHGEGDVWTHTQMVLRALLEQQEYQQASNEERFVLFITALLHDMAKPDTTVVNPVTGRIGQPGHSRRGALDARLLLWRAGVPFKLREQVCRIIAVHQLPFYALADDQTQSPEFMVHRLSWELPVWMLCCMAKADMQGRICADQANILANVELFRLIAKEEGCLHKPRSFVDDHTRVQYFRGANILPDYSLYAEEGSKVLLMSGLPASGKNYWVERNCPDLPIASYDDARIELGLKYGKNEGKVSHLVQDRVKEWLRNKEPFVWNATHLSREMRQRALNLLYAYNAQVKIVYIEQDEKELYRRNSKRDTTLTNQRLQEMFFKWEIPLPTEAHEVEYVIGDFTAHQR